MERCGHRYIQINLLQGKRPGANCIGERVRPTTGTEDLALTGIRSPDSSARSESQYRLYCPSHIYSLYNWK